MKGNRELFVEIHENPAFTYLFAITAYFHVFRVYFVAGKGISILEGGDENGVVCHFGVLFVNSDL